MANNPRENKKIGIIAPFRAQVAEIRRQAEERLVPQLSLYEIKQIVDTVDRFQGSEREVVIFSLTILDMHVPEILKDRRRVNVALSRAQKKLIGVGNWSFVHGVDVLQELKEYVQNSEKCVFIEKARNF